MSRVGERPGGAMPVPRPGPAFNKAASAPLLPLLLLALAAAGCVGGPEGGTREHWPTAPPGFSADTFTRAGLVSGATATEAGCRALPDAIWVDIGHRREC